MPVYLIVSLAALAGAGLVFFYLCFTPRGLAGPGTGFLLKLAALIARKGETPWDAAIRRTKNEADFRIVSKPPKADIKTRDLDIASGGGQGMALRIYGPTSGSAQGASGKTILFFHGGGHVLGSLDGYDSLARYLCVGTGAQIVSVGYRLAPEHPFPAAPQDALAAYKWLLAEKSAGRSGSAGIFVMGDSAGGNLAAVLCQSVVAAGLELPQGCVMLYPVTDLSRMDTDSYRRFETGYLLTKKEMEWFRSLYLPSTADWGNPIASPLLAPSLAGHPRTLLITADFDVLRDEGEAYADRLIQAGVEVELHRLSGTIHGFASTNAFTSGLIRSLKLIRAFMAD